MRKTLSFCLLVASLTPLACDQRERASAGVASDAGTATPPRVVEAVFPPLAPWKGASVSLIANANDPWITPAEATSFRETPTYDETVTWLRRLVAAAPELQMVSLGRSGEGRDIWMVVASKNRAFTPEALKADRKPVLFVQAGIHSGEIDGKDAGLMLLRDLTVATRRPALLDRANFLFVPIFNVDGHERRSRFNRINQRGPETMGWRTTSRNVNLNRDYAKADTPEMQAMIAALNRWHPDLYIDVHVTDGVDYQYDVTWGFNPTHGFSPAEARWVLDRFTPAAAKALRAQGHIPGPLIFATNEVDFEKGLTSYVSPARFSTGYGDARHLPTILVENHSLKLYRQRVLGTYVLLASALEILGNESVSLAAAAASDRALRPSSIPLTWAEAPSAKKIRVEAIESKRVPSDITESTVVQWTGKPISIDVPVTEYRPEIRVARARAYWIPAPWKEVIERLALHGIAMERIAEPRTVSVEMYRLSDPKIEPEPLEGRPKVTATTVPERRTETFPAGSVRVSTDQPLGDLAALLLEPSSKDSFFQWGFFLEILQRTEYSEAYMIEPLARRMMAENPALAAEFKQRLANDEAFRADPAARLQWFFDRTPYADARWRLYPVGRE